VHQQSPGTTLYEGLDPVVTVDGGGVGHLHAADRPFHGKGRVRRRYFGEGAYAESERVIQELLKENGAAGLDETRMASPPRPISATARLSVSRRLSEWRGTRERRTP
jgi:hypothetical protein